METFNEDPKPGRLVLPLVLIGMIATTYTFINRIASDNELNITPVVEEVIDDHYQNQINDKNLLKYGSSFFYDRFVESFSGSNVIESFDSKERLDIIPGLFSEYQFDNTRLNIITGLNSS